MNRQPPEDLRDLHGYLPTAVEDTIDRFLMKVSTQISKRAQNYDRGRGTGYPSRSHYYQYLKLAQVITELYANGPTEENERLCRLFLE